MNGREMVNFNSLVFSSSIWKTTYNAEIRTEHFLPGRFSGFKVFISLSSLDDRVQRPDLI